MLLLIVMLPLLLGVGLTAWGGRRWRSSAAAFAGAITLGCIGLLLSEGAAVFDGQTVMNAWAWVPEIGLNLTFRLDGLSLMFALLITGIGLLIDRKSVV